MARTIPASRAIRARLKRWAVDGGIACDDKGYVLSLDANFFQPLTACTMAELAQGDGAELGSDEVPGKIQALHSSSALACNVFDYWRGRDTGPLALALGTGGRFCSIQFEVKFPTGLGGKPPNLDLLLGKSEGGHTAVESKFLEAYAGAKPKVFKEKYFPEGEGLWTRVGLPKAQAVAERLRADPGLYKYLDAQQLLKHLLGLGQRRTSIDLLYLWFDPGDEAGRGHADEIGAFLADLEGLSVSVSALSYQAMYRRLAEQAGHEHQEYLAYLERRYFVSGG